MDKETCINRIRQNGKTARLQQLACTANGDHHTAKIWDEIATAAENDRLPAARTSHAHQPDLYSAAEEHGLIIPFSSE
jgi:hypothetical protein